MRRDHIRAYAFVEWCVLVRVLKFICYYQTTVIEVQMTLLPCYEISAPWRVIAQEDGDNITTLPNLLTYYNPDWIQPPDVGQHSSRRDKRFTLLAPHSTSDMGITVFTDALSGLLTENYVPDDILRWVDGIIAV